LEKHETVYDFLGWAFEICLGFGHWSLGFMKVISIAFVGIPVTDVKRARDFYEGVLRLKLSEEMGKGHWIEYAIGDGTLALANFPEQWKPSADGTSVAIEVENFDEAIKRLKDRHVPFDAEPFESPVCRMAVIQDPDGNKIIIHKLKPK
jgi:predicted enzyme related to lactoylglutathione lyase